jgi:hypothetical protein
LKQILDDSANTTGLKINFTKFEAEGADIAAIDLQFSSFAERLTCCGSAIEFQFSCSVSELMRVDGRRGAECAGQRPGVRGGAMAAWRACWEAWLAAALACVLGRAAWRLLVGGACPRRVGQKSWAATC